MKTVSLLFIFLALCMPVFDSQAMDSATSSAVNDQKANIIAAYRSSATKLLQKNMERLLQARDEAATKKFIRGAMFAIRAGADVNVSLLNDNLQSSLGIAIYLKNPELVKSLLEKGADIHKPQRNLRCMPPIFHTMSTDICRLLIEYGADVNTRFQPSESSDRNQINLNEILLLGTTPLHTHISQWYQVLGHILDVKMKEEDPSGNRLMQYERRLADIEKIFPILFHYGADSSIEDDSGRNVLKYTMHQNLSLIMAFDMLESLVSSEQVARGAFEFIQNKQVKMHYILSNKGKNIASAVHTQQIYGPWHKTRGQSVRLLQSPKKQITAAEQASSSNQ